MDNSVIVFLLCVFTILPRSFSFPRNISSTVLPKFSSILLFGDSLLDTGNNNFINTFVKANHAPYGVSFPGGVATGRFSDGKLISDFMAESLGIKKTVPPFLDPNLFPDDLRTGVCFASAGSGYDDVTAFISGVIPVTVQYNTYFKKYKEKLIVDLGNIGAENLLKNSFVFATSGSNDMFFRFYGNPLKLYTIDQFQDFLLDRIEKFILSLYQDGCRNMAIGGLPPICGPLEPGLLIGCLNNPYSDAQRYNMKLQATLAELQTSLPGSRLVYADLFTPMKELAANPFVQGILVPFLPCCGIASMGPTCNTLRPICGDPSSFMFWDSVHPTQAAYRYISSYLVDTLLPQFQQT